MGMGLSTAYGAKGGADALAELLARRALESQRQFQNQNVLADNDRQNRSLRLQESEAADRKTYNDAQLSRMKEDSASLREQRDATTARTTADTQAKASRAQAAKAYAMDTKNPLKLRQAVEYYLSVGQDVPASFFSDPNEALNRSMALSDHNRDENAKAAAARAAADNPKLPRGVSAYVTKLRGKDVGYDSALKELMGTMGTLQSAHPNLDQASVVKLLRTLYADPKSVTEPIDLGAIDTEK